MTDQTQVWRSSVVAAVHKVAGRPHLPADHTYLHDGRACLVVVATAALAVNAWALFPSSDTSGHDAAIPTASTPSAPRVNAAGKGVAGDPRVLPRVDALKFMSAELVTAGPAWPTWTAAVQYSTSAVAATGVPLRSKLEALLLILSAEAGDDIDLLALKAKLEALLRLPDSVLAQLMTHPDLAAFNETLDGVFQGTADFSAAKVELDKIDVVTTSSPIERIDVVKVNGEPTFVVRSVPDQVAPEGVASSPMSVTPQPPSEFTVVSLVDSPAAMSTFAAAPSVAPIAAPEQTARIMAVPTMEPTMEPAPPVIQPTVQVASDFAVTPSVDPTPTAAPTYTIPSSPDLPTNVPEPSLDVVTSGHEADGEVSTPTQTAEPPSEESTDPSPSRSPDDSGGVTGNEGESSSNDNGGTNSPGGGNDGGGDPSGGHGSEGDSNE